MEPISDAALKEVLEEVEKASIAYHRRILVLTGGDEELAEAASRVISEISGILGDNPRVLYTYHAFFSDGTARRDLFERKLSEKAPGLKVDYVSYHTLDKVLGQTYDSAVLDFLNNLEPNDLGKLMGVVKGGGIYVFLMPSLDVFVKLVTRFRANLVTPPRTVEELRDYFERRFVRKLFIHSGIAIYDLENRRFVKRFPKAKARRYIPPPLLYPEKTKIPRKIFELALTQDQVEVLSLMSIFYKKPSERKPVLVVTADRGRGKSSAIGLGLGGLAHRLRKAKGRCRILVTAPNPSNAQEVFRFAAKALKRLKHSVNVEEESGYYVAVRAKGIDIEYVQPVQAARTRADLVAVDEAASIPVPLLFSILERHDRVVYSSTIHGYEGAGRGFSIRFLGKLRTREDVEVYEYEMKEPIRYAPNDPVERWVFDTLLLDAEPAELDSRDIEFVEELRVEYYEPELEEFFLENEDELRQFFGIYILAHYRNNPNDLGIMMDAPHHFPRALRLPSKKIVVSLELAEEGGLDEEISKESAEGAWILGNIIPDRIMKHYKLVEFGSLRGVRIVRIATHPKVMRRGLGSKALQLLEEEAKKRGYDWVGAGFGVTYDLLKFWLKNGYLPVHMSPERNPVSGEYTVIVIKPLSERARKFIDIIAWEFKKKFLRSLVQPYFDLEVETALQILEALPSREKELRLGVLERTRFLSYAWSDMTLENCIDVVYRLTEHYFLADEKPELDDVLKKILVAKILQAKTWRLTCAELGVEPPMVMQGVKEAARALSSFYLGVTSEDEAKKHFHLRLRDLSEEHAT